MNTTTQQAPMSEGVGSNEGFGFTVGQDVTVTRRLWEPADDCHPGGMLAHPGDWLIVRAIRDRGEWPISVSHHDRTDGMTFSVAPDELRAYTAAAVKPNVGGEARLAAHQPSQTTTATPQGVASTDQLGGRVRSEKD